MCHVANGNMGHVVLMPEELARIRAQEAQEAGKTLGAKKVFTLGVPDLMAKQHEEETVRKMVEIIRQVKPEVIITHNDEDYMRDHVEVSKLVFNASFVSSIVHYETESPAYGAIVPIYYMDTLAGVGFDPSHYVDVTEAIEVKLAALEKHESQIKWMREHDKIDFVEFVRTCSKFRGYQSSVGYAEAFRPCKAWPRLSAKHLLP